MVLCIPSKNVYLSHSLQSAIPLCNLWFTVPVTQIVVSLFDDSILLCIFFLLLSCSVLAICTNNKRAIIRWRMKKKNTRRDEIKNRRNLFSSTWNFHCGKNRYIFWFGFFLSLHRRIYCKYNEYQQIKV